MAIKVFGAAGSTCTKRVLTTLVEKKVPYELVPIDFATAENKSPEFLKKQPFGKIPVLEDDGFLVFESKAICKYIAKKYAEQGTKLIPETGDLESYGLFEQACSIEQSYFTVPAEAIVAERVFKKYRGLEADETLVSQYVNELDNVLSIYENILAKQKYLAGNEVSLADLFHLPYGKMVKDVGFKDMFEKHPKVKGWFENLEKRASWIDVGLVGF